MGVQNSPCKWLKHNSTGNGFEFEEEFKITEFEIVGSNCVSLVARKFITLEFVTILTLYSEQELILRPHRLSLPYPQYAKIVYWYM